MGARRLHLCLFGATLSVATVAASHAAAPTSVPPALQRLYAAAKKEGRPDLYGGGPAALYTGCAKEFERQFPGIRVEVTADFSNILAPKIDLQLQHRKPEVDLAIFQTLQDFDRWKRAGALVRWKPQG